MSKNKVKALVKAYAKIIKEHYFRFKQIYLFGSCVHGKTSENSNIDVAVVVGRGPKGRKFLDKEM